MSGWLRTEICASIIVALGHFLWQGVIIALLTAIAIRALDCPQRRYRYALCGLIVMPVCTTLTIAWSLNSNRESAPVIERISHSAISNVASIGVLDRPLLGTAAEKARSDVPLRSREFQSVEATSPLMVTPNLHIDWRRFAPVLVGLYGFGAAMMLLRLLVGLWGGRVLRDRSATVTDIRLLSSAERLARVLGLKYQPLLAYCERVAVPTVVGLFKPIILLPITFTSGLTPQQVDTILAHELAHLARCDHVINILQRVIESLLFFHPAVWWLSQRVREEREICCDCLVLANGADPLDYARSLLSVAEMGYSKRLSTSVATVSLFVTGTKPSALRQRIAGILGEPASPSLRLNSRSLLIAIAIPLLPMMVALRSNATNSDHPVALVNRESDDIHSAIQETGAQPIAGDSWPVFRGNAESHGVALAKLPDRMEIIWEVKVVNGAFESTPAIVDGRVYLGDTDGEVYCLDLVTGKTVWEFESDGSFVASPAYRDGILVVGDTDGRVLSLSVSDGKPIWEFKAEGPIRAGANFSGDLVLVCGVDGALYALKLRTGELVWKYATEDQLRCTPTISGKLALLGGCDGSLHFVDLDTGKAAGEKVSLGGQTGSTPAVMGELVIVPTHGGRILGINAVTRSARWISNPSTSREVTSSPAISGDLVFISSQNRRLSALDVTDSSLKWEAVLKNPASSSPVVCDGRVYVADSTRLYAFELATGKEMLEVQLEGEILGSPAIANGRLVIASSNGVVYCLGHLESDKVGRRLNIE
ncbi:MAG: PQQ-binding-like beta-propeller repeat protein [Pirellulaceae bacterium]|nr:PQQ-binding-like beta-propeller repeat protein [Pirellulaceae bacterium]